MSRKLTASDRKALIRLASDLPKGSDERKAILSGLEKTARGWRRSLVLLHEHPEVDGVRHLIYALISEVRIVTHGDQVKAEWDAMAKTLASLKRKEGFGVGDNNSYEGGLGKRIELLPYKGNLRIGVTVSWRGDGPAPTWVHQFWG